MIKEDLIETFKTIKKVNHLTYKELESLTDLAPSQISNILKRDGCLVSIEALEKAINKLGFYVEPLDFKFTGEEDED